MISKSRRSLRWQLVMLSLALLVPTLLFVGILLHQIAGAERQRVETEAEDLSRGLAVALDREINSVLTTVQALATSPSLQSRDLAAFYGQIGEVGRLQGINISLRDIDGHLLLTTRAPFGAPVAVPPALAQTDREVLRTHAAAVTDIFTSATSTKPVFQVVAAPVMVAGSPTYMLGASVDVDYLAETIQRAHLPAGWIGAIVDRRGVFVARSERQSDYAGTPATPDFRAHTTDAAEASGSYYGRSGEGREILAGYYRSELTGWTASTSIGQVEVNAPQRRLLLILVGLGVGLGALATGSALVAGRRIGMAFGRLRTAADAIARGQLVSPVTTPIAEVDEVGRALQAASQQLIDRACQRDEANAALRGLNETLEERVLERTRERNRWWEATTDLVGTAGFDGFLKAVNPAWTTLLGWSEHELLSRPFLDLVTAGSHSDFTAATEKLAAGENLTGYVEQIVTKAGALRTVMWTAVPVLSDRMVYLIGRDITEQREIEERLRQSQKMEAVGQLTGGIAHDFNNLLQGIGGSLEMLNTRIAQGRVKDVERYVTAAQGASRRAAALTHRLLAFSRRQTLDPKPTDVNRLAAGMEELIRRTLGPQIVMEPMFAEGGLWSTLVDPSQLENALLNLCINARDAMPNGGKLTIETGNRWLDESAARQRELPPGQYVSLCVSDNGTGMSPEIAAKAFDPFFTTKPIGRGTGLGLSMIYGFARQSGGQVRIYSEVGQGTKVCIYLPRHAGGDDHDVPLAELGEAPRAEQGETVLVVDDEPTVRMLVTEVLEDLGYVAIEAADGTAGLEVLRSEARVDLLVTDVGLPGGMNGRQMAEAARQTRPDLKVLFITGYAENAVLSHGHLEPGMHVLTKPFLMETLGRRIKELIS